MEKDISKQVVDQSYRSGRQIRSADIALLLEALVEKSLVSYDPSSGRYVMIESVHAYAGEASADLGESAGLAQKHAACFLSLVEAAAPHLQGSEPLRWMERLEQDHDNMRVSMEAGHFRLQFAAKLWRFWLWAGLFAEGSERCRAALRDDETPTRDRAEALRGAGILSYRRGEYGQAQAYLAEALAIRRTISDPYGEAQVLQVMGIVAQSHREYALSRKYTEAALGLYRLTGVRSGEADALSNLGCVAEEEGDLDEATRLHHKSLVISREFGNRPQEAVTLTNLGLIARRKGDHVVATHTLRSALRLHEEMRNRRGIAECLLEMGYLAREMGAARRAAILLAVADKIRAEMGAELKPRDRELFDEDYRAVLEELGAADFEVAIREAKVLSMAQSIHFALHD